jgi:DNA-binding CsgD family transcriptional regulator
MRSLYKLDSAGERPLSSREQQVYELRLKGTSIKEIAFQLGIAENTVSCHVSNMMRKKGVQSIGGLIAQEAAKDTGSIMQLIDMLTRRIDDLENRFTHYLRGGRADVAAGDEAAANRSDTARARAFTSPAEPDARAQIAS